MMMPTWRGRFRGSDIVDVRGRPTTYHARCERCNAAVDPVRSWEAMGIFSRLGTLIKSNINDLITKAEDPEKMLTQVLLQKQYTSESDKAKEWERKAMVAVRAGDDNLARQALARKQEHETIATQFQQQWICLLYTSPSPR